MPKARANLCNRDTARHLRSSAFCEEMNFLGGLPTQGPKYLPCAHQNQAVVGLQASLTSSLGRMTLRFFLNRFTSALIFFLAQVEHPLIFPSAGWSSLVARQAHNLKAAGSNPAPATTPLLFPLKFQGAAPEPPPTLLIHPSRLVSLRVGALARQSTF